MAYRDLMRVATVRSTAAVALALALCSGLVLATLSACAAEPGPTPTTSKATDAPVFASDEEALAAAEKAYAAYLAASNEIIHAGGQASTDLSPFVTASFLEDEKSSLDWFVANGYHGEGDSTFDSLRLQQWSASSDQIAHASAYLCLDVSKTKVVDSGGNDVTASNRDPRLPFQVEFEGKSAGSDELIIAASSTWEGTDFC